MPAEPPGRLPTGLTSAELSFLLAAGFDAAHPALTRVLAEAATASVPLAAGQHTSTGAVPCSQRILANGSASLVLAALRVSLTPAENNTVADLVAVKVMRSSHAARRQRGAVETECETLKASQGHAHVVKLLADVRTPEGTVMLVMEFLGGGTLERWISQNLKLRRKESGSSNASSIRGSNSLAAALSPTFGDHELIRISKQIVWAASFLHAKRIYHRNICLTSIAFVTPPLHCSNTSLPAIKIFDFGNAIRTQTSSEPLATQCAAPAYACPEMTAGRPYDLQKADVYSIGVVLFHMVTGRFPFEDKTGAPPSSYGQAAKVFNEFPCFEGVHWARFPSSLEATVRRMLKRNQSERPTLNQVLSSMECMLCEISAALSRKTSAGLQKKKGFNGFSVLKKSASTVSDATALSLSSSQDITSDSAADQRPSSGDAASLNLSHKKASRRGLVKFVRGGLRHLTT